MPDHYEDLLAQFNDNAQGNAELSDAIALRKAGLNRDGSKSIADIPVTRAPLAPPMRGDGRPAVNPGIQYNEAVGMPREFARPSVKPTPPMNLTGEAPLRTQQPASINDMNGYQNGPGPGLGQRLTNTAKGFKQMMPQAVPAPTTESLQARQGGGSVPMDLLRALIERLSNPKF